MNVKKLTILLSIIAIGCQSNRQIVNQKNKDRVEIFDYKNFQGERIEDLSGIAITREFYIDDKLVSVKYFDLSDEPVINKKPWRKQNAEWRFEYDEHGNFIRQTAYDVNGDIFDVEHWSNSAIEIYEYNEKNELVKRSNYDKTIKLVGLGDIGAAMYEYGYNSRGQLIWRKGFDEQSNFISNGFCYQKYEYNEDGSLKRVYYLYDEDKINMYLIFSYKDGNLEMEETFDEKGNKIGYKVYSYKNSRIISIKDWFHKWDKANLKKEQITLELDGWRLKNAKLHPLNFSLAGKGEYEVAIDNEGRITNITPVSFKEGRPRFNYEVYMKFKDVILEKENNSNFSLNGRLTVIILNQEQRRFTELNRILNPVPRY
jgi:hypothetical protein